MQTTTDTATVTICRCGWISVAPSLGEANEMFTEHHKEQAGKHDARAVMGVANPVQPDAISYFRRRASVVSAESRAVDNLERWKIKGEVDRIDDGLGVFRGYWNVLKGWMIVGVVALCVWGLWRLA